MLDSGVDWIGSVQLFLWPIDNSWRKKLFYAFMLLLNEYVIVLYFEP